jgi:nucleoid-associated protein YgaU
MRLEKLKITPQSPSKLVVIKVPFNPKDYSIGKSVQWPQQAYSFSQSYDGRQADRKKNAPGLTFGGGESRVLSLELFFDTTEERNPFKVDVRNLTNQLVALTRIEPHQGRPPVCMVDWGHSPAGHNSDFPFTGVVSQLNQQFTLFRSDGTPVRASVSLSFTEYLDPEKDLRITDPEFTTWMVRRGDTLSSIAGELYGDPGQWRQIAVTNNLDNPRTLVIGARLKVPKTS